MSAINNLRLSVENRSSHAFIISPNVLDVVLCNEDGQQKLRGYRDYICREISKDKRAVYAYTLSRGYSTYINGRAFDSSIPEHKRIGGMLQQQTELEPRRWGQSSAQFGHEPLALLGRFERLLYTDCRESDDVRGIALVVENAPYLCPREPSGAATQRVVDEALLRWGYDRIIRALGNIVVLLAAETAGLGRDLTSARSGYETLGAPYPDQVQRSEVLSFVVPELPPDDAERLGQQANGLRLADMETLGRRHGTGLSVEHIKEQKAVVLEGVCHGLVELIEPRFGLNDANAQAAAKRYLQSVAQTIVEDIAKPVPQRRSYIPKGLLFVGPPGNGKSHLTMAFAKDCGMTMVRFKNIRSMWVGESERNMEAVLDILPALRPVVVFLDEIDQMVSARGMSGQATSHETEQRILGRLLAFMGDDRYRGEILWIGATNRPDLLDAAMLRRFDRVLPFMNPSSEQIAALVSDVSKQLGLQLEGEQSTWEAIYLEMAQKDVSCDAVLKIIRHAHELASYLRETRELTPEDVRLSAADYISNHNPARYEVMCLSSLASVSFVSDLPWASKAEVPAFLQGYLLCDQTEQVIGLDRPAITERLREYGNVI